MNSLNKKVSLVLILTMILCYLPIFPKTVHAALTVSLSVNSYDSGTLTVRWPAVANSNSVRITYHKPLVHDAIEITSNQSTNTATITGLEDNNIYDIRLDIYNNLDCSGTLLCTAFMYFCPKITFSSQILEQERRPVPGGGYEIGVNPGINLKWAMPKVWVPDPLPTDPSNGSFRYANEAASLQAMQDKINSVYNDGRQLRSLNFRINISTDFSTLNSGSAQSAILVNQVIDGDTNLATPDYTANVSGNTTNTSSIHNMDSDGYVNFDLIGRADNSSALPIPSSQYQLPDGEILPGTVFYMNIKPVFKNGEAENVNAVTVGAASNQNGSNLTGSTPYTYSPIRFQISRDESNNVYVKIYRINQGSLDLPGLKYEVQTGDDPTIEGDWRVRKWLNDSFFPDGSNYAVTAFTVTNANNLLYYKVVVKTDSSDDRLESPSMPYILSTDTSRPPVPTGLTVIDRTLVLGEVSDPVTHETVEAKSSDITISWNKPVNWDTIRRNAASYNESIDVYYHFLISTSQSDMDITPYPQLEANGKIYGNFPVKYRLVKYVSALSSNIRENGNRLEYTLKGFDLFTAKGSDFYNRVDGTSDIELPNTENYPDHLLPNKVYYLQMYTTNGINKGLTDVEKTSDKSVTISFTTLTEAGKDVPLPINFRLNRNDSGVSPGTQGGMSNLVELQFDKVDINWTSYTSDPSVTKAVYYDLYAGLVTEADKLIPIGSTENTSSDVGFIGTDAQSTSIRCIVSEFSEGTQANTVFGSRLRPNSTYYFVARTRVVVGDIEYQSLSTSIIAVTTVIGSISTPDESSRMPLSPADFAIAKDESGNPVLTGSMVALNWTHKEPDVSYNIICTTEYIEPDAPPSTYTEDQYYTSFNSTFGELVLDPTAIPPARNFEYDPASKICNYTINTWLSPNKLYYFSIRAVNETTGKASPWISIPVTTLLIDPPTSLQPVTATELALFWIDNNANTRAEDFKIYLKGPDDNSYNALTKTQYIVSKDGGTYYGRIFNLKPNSTYNVRVYKGNADLVLTLDRAGMTTKDTCHSIEVKWTGQRSYKYNLTAKSSEDDNYTVIFDSDLEQYTDAGGNILPYYIEQPPELNGTDYYTYHARINTIAVRQNDGTIKHVPLSSNMKYYVKVRSSQVDRADTAIVSYSKYIGPVEIRTEFNQDDYNRKDDDKKNEASFLDKIDALEKTLFWRVAINSNINKLLIKGDKLSNALHNNGRYPYVLDISETGSGMISDVIYIPLDIIKILNKEDISLVIKASGAEYTLRPRTIDLESRDMANILSGIKGTVKDIYFKMSITRSSTPDISLPAQMKLASKVNRLDLKAHLVSKTDAELGKLINDKLYNDKTGLVKEKTNLILSSGTSRLSSKEIEGYMSDQVLDMEAKLSEYIEKTIEGSSQTPGMITSTSDIVKFSDPMIVGLSYETNNGQNAPYTIYQGTNTWNRINNSTSSFPGSISFNASGTGKYSVLYRLIQSDDIPEGYYASADITRLRTKYDLGSIFGSGTSFYPDSPVSVKEVILLYEKVVNNVPASSGLSLTQKCSQLGLDTILNPSDALQDIDRQHYSAVMAKLYALKMGVSLESLTPSRNLPIGDESEISSLYIKSVLVCLDQGIMTLNEKGSFRPQESMTRSEVIVALSRLLELAGEI